MHATYEQNSAAADQITFADFAKVDVRIGTVRDCSPFPEARNPSYILLVDFGPAIGVRKSAAQVTARYTPKDLIGRRVMAVVNFPPRQIGPCGRRSCCSASPMPTGPSFWPLARPRFPMARASLKRPIDYAIAATGAL